MLMSPILDKRQMSEEDIKLHFITPAITAKWTVDHMTMETKFTDSKQSSCSWIPLRSMVSQPELVPVSVTKKDTGMPFRN